MSLQTNPGAEVCKAKSLCPQSGRGCAAALAPCRAPLTSPLPQAGAGTGMCQPQCQPGRMPCSGRRPGSRGAVVPPRL